MNSQEISHFDALYARLCGTAPGARQHIIAAMWPAIERELRGTWTSALYRAAPTLDADERYSAAAEKVVRELQKAVTAPQSPLGYILTIARNAVFEEGRVAEAREVGAGAVAAVRRGRFAARCSEQLEASLGRTATLSEQLDYANAQWVARRVDPRREGTITADDVLRQRCLGFDEEHHSPNAALEPLDQLVAEEDADEAAGLFAGLLDEEMAVLASVYLDGADSAASAVARLRTRGSAVSDPGAVWVARSDVDSLLRTALAKVTAARGHDAGLVAPAYRFGAGKTASDSRDRDRELIAA